MKDKHDIKLPFFTKENADRFLVYNEEGIVQQLVNMGEYLYIIVPNPGRYYLHKQNSSHVAKLDFDNSLY